MSAAAVEWAWACEGLRPNGKLVLLALARLATDEGVCWPRQSALTDETGLRAETVGRNVADLIARGLVTTVRHAGEAGRPTTYRLNLAARS